MARVMIKGVGNSLSIFVDGKPLMGVAQFYLEANAESNGLPELHLIVPVTDLEVDVQAEVEVEHTDA